MDQGSFEANPPFVPVVITEMANHIDQLLEDATGPLSFVVVSSS